MNVYLKNQTVKELIQAGIKDIPRFVNEAVEEKLQKNVREGHIRDKT